MPALTKKLTPIERVIRAQKRKLNIKPLQWTRNAGIAVLAAKRPIILYEIPPGDEDLWLCGKILESDDQS